MANVSMKARRCKENQKRPRGQLLFEFRTQTLAGSEKEIELDESKADEQQTDYGISKGDQLP
jgi:hypothetical protein